MRQDLYEKGTANFPRLATDQLFADYRNTYRYTGILNESAKFIADFQLMDPVLWARFVEQFTTDADVQDDGWRGEYWGKMMRGACFVYSYLKDEKLYQVITDTVHAMMEAQDAEGRISSYSKEHELYGWDLWSRKYVMLGMEYYLEICEDPAFAAQIVTCLKKQADYLMTQLGPGKKNINECTNHWRGLNSSSILEPVVRLYSLTGEQCYLDLATYIVNEGGTSIINIFDLAWEDQLYPYQYPQTKAYEMTSCFEGLLEYYRVTGVERYKEAVIRYADKVLESDFTIIGSSGCTHELFDHSTVRQANTTNHFIMQETCVTVTMMKFFYQLLILTGDSKYADAFETALYNAYLGAINTEKVIEPSLKEEFPDCVFEPLPFDSYSPLTSGTRGRKIGGFQVMADRHYYGCCACIGSAGIGLVPKVQLLSSVRGFAMNLYVPGVAESVTPGGQSVAFVTETQYPAAGFVRIGLKLERPETFELKLRIPAYSKETTVTVNGIPEVAAPGAGYVVLDHLFEDGDVIELMLDMNIYVHRPIPYGEQVIMTDVNWGKQYVLPVYDREDPLASRHIALTRGPLVLAQDEELGYSTGTPIAPVIAADGTVSPLKMEILPEGSHMQLGVSIDTGSGEQLLIDYASAGKSWRADRAIAAWLLTEPGVSAPGV